jgi:hypothetical protein
VNRLSEAIHEPEYQERIDKNCLNCQTRFTTDIFTDYSFCCPECERWYDEQKRAENEAYISFLALKEKTHSIRQKYQHVGIELGVL